MDSKKLKMVLASIAGVILVLVVKGLFPDMPDDVIQWAIAFIGGSGPFGAFGQAIADGMSRGLTSSSGPRILAAQTQQALQAGQSKN